MYRLMRMFPFFTSLVTKRMSRTKLKTRPIDDKIKCRNWFLQQYIPCLQFLYYNAVDIRLNMLLVVKTKISQGNSTIRNTVAYNHKRACTLANVDNILHQFQTFHKLVSQMTNQKQFVMSVGIKVFIFILRLNKHLNIFCSKYNIVMLYCLESRRNIMQRIKDIQISLTCFLVTNIQLVFRSILKDQFQIYNSRDNIMLGLLQTY